MLNNVTFCYINKKPSQKIMTVSGYNRNLFILGLKIPSLNLRNN